MMLFRVQGIPGSVAESVRSSLRSPQYGHPAHAELATGTGPCRLCLEPFTVGRDQRLLFTYQPFSDPGALPAPGPVFIHRESCRRYDALEMPAGLSTLPLVLEGYGEEGTLLARRRIEADAGAALAEVFGPANVRYAHLRHGEAGCFVARVDRCYPCD
jgi:uncharacterized protein DUF1203